MNESILAKIKAEADNIELELNIYKQAMTFKDAGTEILTFISKESDPFAGVTKNGEPNPWLVNPDGGCVIC